MPLAGGTRLGPFEVGAPLGAGGMGEVYRARDTRLNRDVAIKILPGAFALDADRLARFKREAQVLAALNHPHIAAIYGLEETDGIQALVLELVEGPTLADRIMNGPLAPDEALPIARQIAEALEAAHEQGIIHRDLKPANIKLRDDGSVKVLDFGLAKLASGDKSASGMAALSMSPTITTPAATGIGMILGTAAYMAPEQARGKAVDRRADVWAFGCVLYEMLTAHRAFPGEDVTETIASVVKGEPDWSALPTDLPPTLRVYLRRCLQKNPRDRIHDIGDMRLALEGALDLPPSATASSLGTDTAVASWRRRAPFVLGAIVLIALGAIVARVLTPAVEEPPPAVRRFSVTLPQLGIAINNRDVVIAPDGTKIAYFAGVGANRQLYVRALDALEGTPIRHGERFFEPFFSPDSQWIAFNDEIGFLLKKMPASGGPPVTIAPVGRAIFGATWGPDDTIVFATGAPGTGLSRVPAGGGKPEVLTTPDKGAGEVFHAWPEYLPGGRALLYTIGAGGRGDEYRIAALNLESGERKLIVQGGSNARYLTGGYLSYSAENTIRAVRFDPARLEVTGDAVTVLEGLTSKVGGGASFSVSVDGTLAYVPGVSVAQRRVLVVGRSGSIEPLETPARNYSVLRFSPDGSRAALVEADQERDIWIWDFGRKTLTRLTADRSTDYSAVWTPDGRQIAFSSQRAGVANLFMQAADGTGAVRRLTESPLAQTSLGFSPDGSRLVFAENPVGDPAGADLRILVLSDPPRIEPLLHTSFNERNGQISPDGKWFAYQSNESDRTQVYVRPFPNLDGGRWQISTGEGVQPAWSPAGGELFYIDADRRLMAVSVRERNGALTVDNPVVVIDEPFWAGANPTAGPRMYDVSPDGKRFLMLEDISARAGVDVAGIVVVLNWAEELRRLVPDQPRPSNR